MEQESVLLLRSRLPREWVVREYKPDYGIDLVAELFSTGTDRIETLGEHVFLQIKSSACLTSEDLILKPHPNVEKYWLHESTDVKEFLKIPVFKLNLETSILETARLMGPAVPLVLILICLNTQRVFFLCLTDYVDKIILPRSPLYAEQRSTTVAIPESNEITSDLETLMPLRWYAKRPKFYAAFTKFEYQYRELAYTDIEARGDEREALERFFQIADSYDIWSFAEWQILLHYRNKLDKFGAKLKTDVPTTELLSEAKELWRGLALLGANLEDLVREWFLPSHIGCISSNPAFY
jgi:uncharacterized protein DUF4365